MSGGENTGLNFYGLNIQCYTGDYNLFHMNAPERAIATSELDYSLTQIQNGEWTAASGQDAHSRVAFDANTLFVDTTRTRPDLHLRSGSPAIDNGGMATGVPTVDFDSTMRSDGKIDIGAFEYAEPSGLVDNPMEISPQAFTIEHLYPNPIVAPGRQLTVTYSIPHAANITLSLIDFSGRRIAILESGARTAGRHEAHLTFDAIASGLYTCVLQTGDAVVAKTLIAFR
jgi:hypothetical protein